MRPIALVALLVACGAHVPPVPGQGGPAWTEVTSPHFTVWTDAAPAQVGDLVTRMERMRAILGYAAFPSAPAEGRTLAIVLRDDAELRAMTATGQARPFAAPVAAPLWQPLIVLSASSHDGPVDRTLAHELTHAISFGVVHHQPRWFAEGMASYFQTAGLDARNDIVEIGGAPSGDRIYLEHVLPLVELFQWTAVTRDEQAQYVTAWALIFFLVNQHGDELQRFARLLDAAGAGTSRPDVVEQLWDRAFTSLPFRDADRALRDWLGNGSSYVVKRLKIAIAPPVLAQRALGDADVYAIRGLLHALAGKPADARPEIAAALAREPTQVLARILAMLIDHTRPSLAEAIAIADAHAGDFRAWMLLADARKRGDPAGALVARRRACALVAANPALAPPDAMCASQGSPPPSP